MLDVAVLLRWLRLELAKALSFIFSLSLALVLLGKTYCNDLRRVWLHGWVSLEYPAAVCVDDDAF
jgi:hypothetical protein